MIRRVLRLWLLYAWLDLTWATRDLKFALTYLVADLIVAVTTVTGVLLLAERFGGIGAWSRAQVVFMLGYAILVRAIVDAGFGYNVAFVSRRIGRGQLDHALIQPQPLWLGLLTDGFNPVAGASTFLPASALLLWSGVRLGLPPTPGWLALALANVAASSAIVLAYSYLWGSLAFWTPRGAEEINSATMRLLEQLKPFPLDGLGPGLLGGMLTLIPAGFVAWYPCRALLGLDPAGYAVGVTPLAAVVLGTLAALVFRRGMQHYGQTGSQRYLSMGHRR